MDILKQTGKQLKRTQDETDYSLVRPKKNYPTIERDREVITYEDPFYMEFVTYTKGDNLTLTIEIKEDFV